MSLVSFLVGWYSYKRCIWGLLKHPNGFLLLRNTFQHHGITPKTLSSMVPLTSPLHPYLLPLCAISSTKLLVVPYAQHQLYCFLCIWSPQLLLPSSANPYWIFTAQVSPCHFFNLSLSPGQAMLSLLIAPMTLCLDTATTLLYNSQWVRARLVQTSCPVSLSIPSTEQKGQMPNKCLLNKGSKQPRSTET